MCIFFPFIILSLRSDTNKVQIFSLWTEYEQLNTLCMPNVHSMHLFALSDKWSFIQGFVLESKCFWQRILGGDVTTDCCCSTAVAINSLWHSCPYSVLYICNVDSLLVLTWSKSVLDFQLPCVIARLLLNLSGF